MSRARVPALVVAVLAVVVAAALVVVQKRTDSCQAAFDQVRVAGLSGDGIANAADTVLADCDGSDTPARVAGFLAQRDQRPQAVRLARAATRRGPDDYVAWATLAVVSAPDDPALARRARTRALELNPRAGRDRP